MPAQIHGRGEAQFRVVEFPPTDRERDPYGYTLACCNEIIQYGQTSGSWCQGKQATLDNDGYFACQDELRKAYQSQFPPDP